MPFVFSADVLEGFLRKVYGGFDTGRDVEPAMWREVLRIVSEATVEGLSQRQPQPTREAWFYREMRHSCEVFSAFKVHAMGEAMAARLHDGDGNLKPYRKWLEDVRGIASHHVGAWLRTEYDTAVIRAHNAADWRVFERDKDIMPNLRWMPTTSPTPEGSHRAFWERRVTLPVGHPFWGKHHPGDRWNCKCSLEQTDDPATPVPADDEKADKPQRGLENNPGKDGHVYNDTHPYFPKSCSECGFYRKANLRNRLLGGFANRKKDCYNCPYIDTAILRDERREDYLKYKSDQSYKNVEFDKKNLGLKAEHIYHNIDKNKGWYETTAQDVGYRNGHKVILEKETHSVIHQKNTEGTWDDMPFEIAAAETATANNIRRALKHCASKPNTDVAVIFFPNNNFDKEVFENGFAKYKGLKGTSQYRKFKAIYCVDKEKIILTKKPG